VHYKQLRRAGFFRELRHGDPTGPSLRDCVADAAAPDEDQILKYLASGNLLVGCLGIADDVLKPGAISASPHIMTDGVWAWSNDLEYYVRTYHARLPTEFVEHMRANQWRAPRLSDDEIGEMDA
jgi:hypothetical protein